MLEIEEQKYIIPIHYIRVVYFLFVLVVDFFEVGDLFIDFLFLPSLGEVGLRLHWLLQLLDKLAEVIVGRAELLLSNYLLFIFSLNFIFQNLDVFKSLRSD